MKRNEIKITSQLLELNPVGAVLLDARKKDLDIIVVNQALVDLTGYTSAEMVGQPWRRLSVADNEPVKGEQKKGMPAANILSRNHQGSNEGGCGKQS